jgi:hypothetical protein
VKDMLYSIAQWRIRKEDSKRHLEMWQQILQEQKDHSEKFFYSRSWILQLAEKEADPTEETWMNIDEYEGREAYDKMMKAIKEDPEVKKFEAKWRSVSDPMRVPGSLKVELWTERLKVELKKIELAS